MNIEFSAYQYLLLLRNHLTTNIKLNWIAKHTYCGVYFSVIYLMKLPVQKFILASPPCSVDANAEVLLHFVLMMQTCPFTVQVASVVVSEMSPICHQFCLVLPLHLSPACSLITSNGNCCTEPFHVLDVLVNCRDWTRHIWKLSPQFAMTFPIRTELRDTADKHAIFQLNPIGTNDWHWKTTIITTFQQRCLMGIVEWTRFFAVTKPIESCKWYLSDKQRPCICPLQLR